MIRRERPLDSAVVFVTAAEFRRAARPEGQLSSVLPVAQQRGGRATLDDALPRVSAVTVVVESDDKATVYLPEISPSAVRAAVDAAAALGQMAKMTGKRVNIVSTDPALVAAFVYAAKPWLRWFRVNGRDVVPAPNPKEEV